MPKFEIDTKQLCVKKPVKFIMPYGKHKGEDIKDFPRGYLIWGYEKIKPGWVRDAIIEEMEARGLLGIEED